jgi:sulfotransferase family protein
VALPTFYVVGAARCGTTTLHNYLDQHPQVAMSRIKEPNHFVFADGRPLIDEQRIVVKSEPSRAGYERLFEVTPDTKAIGDISPLYLYVREAPGLIAAVTPDARIIALVRDPADRAYSHFLLTYDGDADAVGAAFQQAVETEWPLSYTPFRSGTHALRLGRYDEQLRRYDEHFPAERILVLRSGDLAREPGAVLDAVCRFIGVDDNFAFDTAESYNAAGVPRAGTAGRLEAAMRRVQPYVKRAVPTRAVAPLARARERMRRSLITQAPPIDPGLKKRLNGDYYAVDLAAMQANRGIDVVGGGSGRANPSA